MLRVGLTGGLGSGKSTAAALFAAHGAHILSSDEIARALMQPGESVYAAIVERFGPTVVLADRRLDRSVLARMAFQEGRLDELNAIVHPATLARQTELADEIGNRQPQAIVIVESALIFETKYGENKYGETKSGQVRPSDEVAWHRRFDKLILVTAPEALRIARFIARSTASVAGPHAVTDSERAALVAEAERRIARQLPDDQKSGLCDYILTNAGQVTELEWQVDRLWPLLLAAVRKMSIALEGGGPTRT